MKTIKTEIYLYSIMWLACGAIIANHIEKSIETSGDDSKEAKESLEELRKATGTEPLPYLLAIITLLGPLGFLIAMFRKKP